MGTGAVITIDYSIAFGINAFTQSPSNGSDMFSGILDPLRRAKSAGSVIKSELHEIASKIDISTSIGRFFSSDDGEYKLQNEISEEAKSAKAEEEVVYGALTNVESKLIDFGTTVIDVDNKAALLIKERKLEFNRRYPHLESETEYRQRMDNRSGWEKAGDFLYGFVHGYGLIGGFDSLINGRERFEQHKEAIEKKIAEFATKTWNWVKENWEAIVAAIVVVAAAIVCIATFGAGTVFLVASLAAFAYAVADKIVAINNNGNGIAQTLEANGFHHLSQICKGFNWGLQITMLISGFGMEGASSFSLFEGSGFFATVGNGAVLGGGYNFAVDLTAHSLNFAYSKDAQSDPMGYLKFAFKDTLKDTISGFVIGGTVAGISYTVINGFSFLKAKSTTSFNIDNEAMQLTTNEGNVEINIPLKDAPHDSNIGNFTYDTPNGGTIELNVTKDNIRVAGDKASLDLLTRGDIGVFEYKYKGDYRLNVQGIDNSGAKINNHHLNYENGYPSVKTQLPTDVHTPEIHSNILESWRHFSYENNAFTGYQRNLNKYLEGGAPRNLKPLSDIIKPVY